MRILFDARGVQGWSDGLSNYVRHILMSLLTVDRTNEYVVLLAPAFRKDLEAAGLLEHPNVHVVLTSIPFMGLAQQVRVPWLARRLPPADVYHYPHFDMPFLAHPRSVVTIYDLNHISFTGYFDSQRRLKQFYSYWTTRLSLVKASRIITISNTTKSEFLKRFPSLDPRKISVVYFGLNENFQTSPSADRVLAFRVKYRLGNDRFILYVGTQRPHKNLDRLLEAFARLRRQSSFPHKLLLVGSTKENGRFRELSKARAIDGIVRHLGYLPEEELPLAYRVADAFVFCSLSEGFGMPLLEAMASQVPIVTSNVGAMAEIAGDSALLVDPFSPEAIADGLHRLLTSDRLRQDLALRGLQRVREFAWEAAARKTLEVYAAVAAGEGGDR